MAGPVAARPGWVAVAAVSLEAYDGTLGELIRVLVVSGVVFVVAAGLAFAGWWFLLGFCGLKTVSACGFCPSR